MTNRNVRWYESRQERFDDAVSRTARLSMRLFERSADLERVARNLKPARRTEASRRKMEVERARLLHEVETLRRRAHRLADRAQAMRPIADRYGREKAHVGVYDRETGNGWRDPRAGEVTHAVQCGIRRR